MGHAFERRAIVRAMLFVSTVLSAGVAAPLAAQAVAPAPAPARQSVDGNGVDLFTGKLFLDGPELSLGVQPQGISYRKLWRGRGWTDNLIATLNGIGGGAVTVTFGGDTEQFALINGKYVPADGGGSMLILANNVFTYTSSDGLVARFDKVLADTGSQYGELARVISIISASGETLTFTYDSIDYCTSTVPNEPDVCRTARRIFRLANVNNRYGYRATVSYPATTRDPERPGFDVGTWVSSNGISLSNLATGTQISGSGFSDATGARPTYRIENGLIVGITPVGETVEKMTIGYTNDRVTSVVTPAGMISYASSDLNGTRTVTVTNPKGEATTYKFAIASQRMTSVTEPVTDTVNRTTSYDIDASGRVTKITRPEGNYTKIIFGVRGNVTEQLEVAKGGTEATGIKTSATYPDTCANPTSCNKPVTTTDARRYVTNYEYAPGHGNVTKVSTPAPDGNPASPRPTTIYTYASVRNTTTNADVILLTDVSTCRTATTCAGSTDEIRSHIDYESGNLLPKTQTISSGPVGGSTSMTTTLTYDPVGNVTAVDGPLAGSADVVRTQYDALRRVTAVVSPDPDGTGSLRNRSTSYHYLPNGLMDSISQGAVDSDGSSNFERLEATVLTFDAAHRKVRETLYNGAVTTAHALTQYRYDTAGRLQCTAIRMDPTQWNDQVDACVPQTNGSNGPDRVTKLEYDKAGQVTSQITGHGTAAAAQELTRYNLNGTVQNVRDAAFNRTSFKYDGFDRPYTTHYPFGTTVGTDASNSDDFEEYQWDAAGNLTGQRTRAGQWLGYDYDALGRMVRKAIPDGCAPFQVGECAPGWSTADIFYGYDLLGNPSYARFNSHTGPGIGFTYGALGRLASRSDDLTGALRTLSYGYDEAGRRTRITHPDEVYFDHRYDYDNALIGASWWAPASGTVTFLTVKYDAMGRRTDVNRGSSYTGYSYEGTPWLSIIDQRFKDGAHYGATTFGRNPAGQIASERIGNAQYTFRNRFNIDRPYTTNGLNQYGRAGSATFTYDRNGNLISDGSTSYVYDPENRLVKATGSRTANLAYNPLGQLLEVSGGAYGRTLFLYDGDHAVAEYDGTNPSYPMKARYMWGPGADEPILWDPGSTMNCTGTRFLHTDQRGSVVQLADCFGNRTAVNAYDEYGIPAGSINSQGQLEITNQGRFQYTGQAWLPELGMYYYKARMYSPTLGRFMQTDPIGYADGLNWYNYVAGDPINHVDPSGLAGDPYPLPDLRYNSDVVVTAPRQQKSGFSLDPRPILRAIGKAAKSVWCGIFGCGKKKKAAPVAIAAVAASPQSSPTTPPCFSIQDRRQNHDQYVRQEAARLRGAGYQVATEVSMRAFRPGGSVMARADIISRIPGSNYYSIQEIKTGNAQLTKNQEFVYNANVAVIAGLNGLPVGLKPGDFLPLSGYNVLRCPGL